MPEAKVQSLAVRHDSDTGSYLLNVAIIYAVNNYFIRRKNAEKKNYFCRIIDVYDGKIHL